MYIQYIINIIIFLEFLYRNKNSFSLWFLFGCIDLALCFSAIWETQTLGYGSNLTKARDKMTLVIHYTLVPGEAKISGKFYNLYI